MVMCQTVPISFWPAEAARIASHAADDNPTQPLLELL